VAIGNLFLANASKLALHAIQYFDRLARNALYAVYLGGHSFVTAALGAPGATLRVDTVEAPTILRPNDRAATSRLVAGDRLTLRLVLAAVARLRDDSVPDFDGYYRCYLDNMTLLELFQDPDFKHLYSGRPDSETWRDGQVIQLLSVSFITTTEAPQLARRLLRPHRRHHRPDDHRHRRLELLEARRGHRVPVTALP
jgi:hypothetical protein